MKIGDVKQSISAIARQVMNERAQYVTPFIQGIPGVGKSQIVRQIVKELGFDEFIDLRMSQHDDTDIKGIPCRINGVFEWVPPEFIPVSGNKRYEGKTGILFFDEVNRATDETLQSIFEVVNDYTVGGKPIIPGWFVICAGNLGYEDGTHVTVMDSAMRNRFAFFTVTSDDITIDEWVDKYAVPYEINPYIVKFLKTHPRFLYQDTDKDLMITPRSWEKMHHVLRGFGEQDYSSAISMIGQGIIHKAAAPFLQFYIELKQKETVMSPAEFLNGSSASDYLSQIERAELYRIAMEVVGYVKHIKNASKVQVDNFRTLFTVIDNDHKIAILKESVVSGKPCSFMSKFLKTYPEYNDHNSELFTVLKNAI
jgi:hypothetical protein